MVSRLHPIVSFGLNFVLVLWSVWVSHLVTIYPWGYLLLSFVTINSFLFPTPRVYLHSAPALDTTRVTGVIVALHWEDYEFKSRAFQGWVCALLLAGFLPQSGTVFAFMASTRALTGSSKPDWRSSVWFFMVDERDITCWHASIKTTVFMALPHVVKHFCFSVIFLMDKCSSYLGQTFWQNEKHFVWLENGFYKECRGFARLLWCLILKLLHAVTRCTEVVTVWDLFGKFKDWQQKSSGVQSAVQINLFVSASRWCYSDKVKLYRTQTIQLVNASTHIVAYLWPRTTPSGGLLAFHLWLCRCVGCEDGFDHILHNMLESKSK